MKNFKLFFEDDFMAGMEAFERRLKPFFVVYCYPVGNYLRIFTREFKPEEIPGLTINEQPEMLELFLSTGRAEFDAYSQSPYSKNLYTVSEEDAAAFAAKLAELAVAEHLTPRFIEL